MVISLSNADFVEDKRPLGARELVKYQDIRIQGRSKKAHKEKPFKDITNKLQPVAKIKSGKAIQFGPKSSSLNIGPSSDNGGPLRNLGRFNSRCSGNLNLRTGEFPCRPLNLNLANKNPKAQRSFIFQFAPTDLGGEGESFSRAEDLNIHEEGRSEGDASGMAI